MPEADIVEAARTAGGRRKGSLADWRPANLWGEVLDAPAPLGWLLRARGGRYGLQAVCEGRGVANATIVEGR